MLYCDTFLPNLRCRFSQARNNSKGHRSLSLGRGRHLLFILIIIINFFLVTLGITLIGPVFISGIFVIDLIFTDFFINKLQIVQ